MSDLGRLFRLRRAPDLEPLENFTTVALAIAIGHDARPLKEALRAVDWTYQGADGYPPLATFDVAPADIISITAETQVTLWPVDGIDGTSLGYLDLVLHVIESQQRESTIWVEVKVDAWEHGNQLGNYSAHAARRSPSPAIITLGRMRVSPHFPSLKWSDIVEAIASVPDAHPAWLSLRDFLLEEKIASGRVPTEPVDRDACIRVIVDVNGRLRHLWPGKALAWKDGDLRNRLKKSFEAEHDLVTSGGPLRYGLMPAGTGWEWGLVVTTENYQKVPLDTQQMLRDADVGRLPQNWLRHSDRFEVLERRVSPDSLSSHDELVAWFDEGLRQLRDAMVLDRYLAGLATKQTIAVGQSQLSEATD